MSQVDKLNYIPLLFWFVLLVFMIYSIFFAVIIPIFHSILKVRGLFLTYLYSELSNLHLPFRYYLYFLNTFHFNEILFVWLNLALIVNLSFSFITKIVGTIK